MNLFSFLFCYFGYLIIGSDMIRENGFFLERERERDGNRSSMIKEGKERRGVVVRMIAVLHSFHME